MIVRDQRLDAVFLRGLAHVAGEFAGVGAEAADLEPQLLLGHPRGGDGVGRVAVDEDALAGQVVGVDGARVPRQALLLRGQRPGGVDARQRRHLRDELPRRADADGHRAHARLAELPLQPARRRVGDLGVEDDVEIGIGQAGQVQRAGPQRRDHVDRDAQRFDQLAHLHDIVAAAEAQRGRAEDVARFRRALLLRRGRAPAREAAHELVERLRRAPVLLLHVGGQLQRDDGDVEAQRLGQPAGIVLDQLGGARGPDHHRLRREPLDGLAAGRLEDLGRVGPQIARLEGGVGHGRARLAPLDHGEQQVGVGVALRRVQHVVQPRHRGGDAHRADMGRAFVCPHRQLHQTATSSAARRPSGRANSSARSPACS